jgi:hypothetical protein
VFDTDDLFDNMFNLPEQDPISENFGSIGYETTFFVRNAGSLAIVLVLQPILALIAFVLSFSQFDLFKEYSQKIKEKLYWNDTAAFIEESFMILALCTSLSIIKV